MVNVRGREERMDSERIRNCSPNTLHSGHTLLQYPPLPPSIADVTPQSINTSTLPFKHKTSVTIFEESQEFPPPHRSRSASQPSREMFLSLQRNAANMNLNGSNSDLSPSRSRSYTQQDVVSLSSQEDVSNKSSRAPSDIENPGGPDSESGYADPIDALRKYYESHNTPPNSDMSSLDAPYQHVSVVQKLREAQMSKVSNYDDDPTYSRPFDCLVGLPNPLKVRGETAPKKILSPLVLQRHSTPDFPVSLTQNRHPTKRRIRSTRKPAMRRSQSSSDEEDLSSSLSPSPEPIYSTPIIHANGGDLLDGDIIDDGRNLLENDEEDILNGGKVGSIDSLEVQSPSPSPLPLPEEMSRLQNGFAQVLYPGVLVPPQ